MSQARRILLIEDEEVLRMALGDALRAEGFTILEAADGRSGLELALREDPDLILLDLMLPGMDGFQVLRGIRQDRMVAPVIILSARGEEWDRIQGFEYGADDYVVKPFNVRELLLRIKAVMKRSGATEATDSGGAREARFGAVVVDFAGYSLECAGNRHGLSRREMDLLRFLLDHEGEVVERSRLLDEVWGQDAFPTTRTVDMHILKLRRKIESSQDQPRHILTVHGVGYKFLRDPEAAAGER